MCKQVPRGSGESADFHLVACGTAHVSDWSSGLAITEQQRSNKGFSKSNINKKHSVSLLGQLLPLRGAGPRSLYVQLAPNDTVAPQRHLEQH